MEAGVQGYPWLLRGFEARLSFMRPCVEEKREEKNRKGGGGELETDTQTQKEHIK